MTGRLVTVRYGAQMEGLRPATNKDETDVAGRRACHERDSQKRSFDFYGQLAIAARLRG